METTMSSKNTSTNDNASYPKTRKLNVLTIKEKLEKFQLENQFRCTEELNDVLNQVLEKFDGNDPTAQKMQAVHDKMIDRIETRKGQLPEKYFMARNSLLTDLVELPHLKTIRNFFIVIWITLFVNAVITDLIKRGKITLGLGEGFTNFHMAVFIWICMFTSTVVVYYAFCFWGTVRVNFLRKTIVLKLWDAVWLLLFVIYCFSFFYFSIRAIINNSLEIIVSKLIVTETIRLFMKTYAFVRSNTPRALKYKLHDEDKILCPEFSKYFYFLFAPTLIYRDSYPRTSHIRWNYVCCCCIGIIGGLLCMHFIQDYILVSSFEDYDLKKITIQDSIVLFGRNALPSFLYWICFLFVFFHAEQNLFAELLQFADRLFYKDWWNSNSFEKIYSNLIVAVYDWLSIYMYKDMYEIVLPKNEFAAKTVEFIFAVLFHELVYSIPYRFYYVPMFFVYCLGIALIKWVSKTYFIPNTIFFIGIVGAITVLRTGLTLEYYVRLSCPVENPTLLSYFIPRTFTCI